MPTSGQETSGQSENDRFRRCCFTQHDEAEPLFSDKLGYLAYAKETCPSMCAPGKSFFHMARLIRDFAYANPFR